jgi:isopentenyl phosphate kinase
MEKNMTTLIKVGGSLITDKRQEATYRASVMQHIARQLYSIKNTSAERKLILGHGSGSFGHFEAKKYDTMLGVKTSEAWFGYAKVAHAARTLHWHVMNTLIEEHLSAIGFQPSASTSCNNGKIMQMNVENIQFALTQNLLPVVYGDVAFDDIRGGTITSTETIFTYLVNNLAIDEIILLGEVDGVYDTKGQVVKRITPKNISAIASAVGGSDGVDVTGGMWSKVNDMLKLVETHPQMRVRIINGKQDGNLYDVLTNPLHDIGTSIEFDA